MLETRLTNTPVKSLHTFKSSPPPRSARAVIVGGGIVGASVAYHLSLLGWKDIVLIEQGHLGGGTTWHAAGMVGQLRTSNSLTKINRYSVELYQKLQEDLGHDIGWLQVGSLIVGTCEERMCQLKRTAAMAEVFDVEAHVLHRDDAAAKWPLIRHDDVLGGVWLPHDGRVIPGATTIALALEAEKRGVQILQETKVESVLMSGSRATGVRMPKGEIHAETVILTGGMWTRQLALEIDVDIPLYPVEHHYVLSEPIDGANRHFPCGRDPDRALYFRTLDDGSIKLGAFQARSKAWMVDRIPDTFAFGLLEDDWEGFAEPLANGKHRIPALENASFPKFVNGPESFTPDNQFIMGEPAGIDGLFVLAGFNSVGIASAGGAGKYAAEWLEQGSPTLDLWSVDIRRFLPFHNDRAFLRERVTETLGLHYQMAWPNREMETARGIKRTPLYPFHVAQNACFGSSMGWERANWFAPPEMEPKVHYSFQKQNWSPSVAHEVNQCRNNIAVLDQSTFTKFILRGPDACRILQHLCVANVDVPLGRSVYTGMLNARGTYETDLTLVRLQDDEFYLVSATAQTVRDRDWITRQIPSEANVALTDMTSSLGVISVMGPKARHLLKAVCSHPFSNEHFPFGTMQPVTIADQHLRALRLSYVGELGWELHGPFEALPTVYRALLDAQDEVPWTPAGHYAINAMRLEKGYRAWGHELSTDETPLEAGLGFTIDWETDFLGKEALLEQRKRGVSKQLLSFVLQDPKHTLWGNEPILSQGNVVGHTTSGAFSPTLERAVALGYVCFEKDHPLGRQRALDAPYHINIDGEHVAATPSIRAPYDPERTKMLV